MTTEIQCVVCGRKFLTGRYDKRARRLKLNEVTSFDDPVISRVPDHDCPTATHLNQTCLLGKDDSGAPWILCLQCWIKSYKSNDIEDKFCGNCKLFHEIGTTGSSG